MDPYQLDFEQEDVPAGFNPMFPADQEHNPVLQPPAFLTNAAAGTGTNQAVGVVLLDPVEGVIPPPDDVPPPAV